ncbi:MAG: ribonuclease Y [Clostridiales bacterium]|nr:MAG: ribonuclease Y [Clostridiales bacterium]
MPDTSMVSVLMIIGVAILSVIIGLAIGYYIRKQISESKLKSAEVRAAEIITNAKQAAESDKKAKLVEARDEIHQMRLELERETKSRRSEVQALEKRNIQKEEQLENRANKMSKREEGLNKRQSSLDKKESALQDLEKRHLEELERVSGLSQDEAKRQLLRDLEKEIKHESVLLIKEAENDIKETANKKAQEIISIAIQRSAADHVSESTVSVVDLPNDEMKGRIIGREGRNIRALETATGVDLIIDDTPEAVILSSFDAVRREIARIALEKLIQDGRIHPARIEEMVEKAKKEVEQKMKEYGENATFEVGIHNLHPELIKLLGRLHYRTSYGQNVLKHSIEVAELSSVLAAELGVNTRIAKRAGLLHDIGKAVDQELEGTHVELGMSLLKRYKESKAVIHAMSTHHGDYEPETIEAILVTAADALSAARPGARRETLNTYIKRLEGLEGISNSYEGVDKSFAIQAGREIRIMVVPEKISDDEMVLLGRDIRKRIEEELDYPGQIKVSMIRETRSVEYAK